MAKYTIEITARYEIETDNIDDLRENYLLPSFEDCKSITDDLSQIEFLDGSFTYEQIESPIPKEWSVWVGGGEINDYYLTECEADNLVAFWKAKGYEEVVKQKMIESEKVNG